VEQPSISVFFPCCNEAENITSLVEKTLNVVKGFSSDFEIIIVDDGSTDGTGEIADSLAAENKYIKAIHHQRNLGYGSALRSGIEAARKELIFYTDGDGQFDIAEMPQLIPLMKQYDIVSCYRINRCDSFIRKINALCWTKLVSVLFKLKVRDIDCAFKLYKRQIFRDMRLASTGALIDTEILARAVSNRYRITQIGVHHYPRTRGRQSGANVKVILRAFKELFKLRRQIKKA